MDQRVQTRILKRREKKRRDAPFARGGPSNRMLGRVLTATMFPHKYRRSIVCRGGGLWMGYWGVGLTFSKVSAVRASVALFFQ